MDKKTKSVLDEAVLYCDLVQLDNPSISDADWEEFVDDAESDIQYYAMVKDGKMVISFRGTDSIKDIFTDLRAWKKVIPYGNYESDIRVHEGFLEAYKAVGVRTKIHEMIEEQSPESIHITGYSLGAALATLCAVDIQYNFEEVDLTCSTLASPRVGNKFFAVSFSRRVENSYRFCNASDIVTRLPYKFMGFDHVAEETHIGEDRIIWMFWGGKFSDHMLPKYKGAAKAVKV